MTQKERYTSGEVARLLGIAPRTARRYISSGDLVGEQHPLTGRWTVSRTELEAFVQKHNLVMRSMLFAPATRRDKV